MVVVGAVCAVVVVTPLAVLVVAGGRVMLHRSELPGLAGCDRVAESGHEQIDAQLGDGGAVYFRELHFKQHFLRPYRAEGQHIDHILGIGLGDHSGTLGNIFGGDMARKHDGGARRRDVDLLVREDPLFFLGGGADVDIHAQVETTRTFQFVPDQQRHLARRPAVNQDLGRGNDDRVGHGVVGDRDSPAAARWC